MTGNLSYQIRIRHCRALVAAIENTGTTVPDSIAEHLAQIDAVRDWTPAPTPSVRDVIRSGKFTAANAAKHLDAVLNAPTRDPRELRGEADHELARPIRCTHPRRRRRRTGRAIRPAFEAAAAGITSAREWINPATTPAQVLDMGDDAAKAWRGIAKHRTALDSIGGIVNSLGSDFGVVGDAQPDLFRGGIGR